MSTVGCGDGHGRSHMTAVCVGVEAGSESLGIYGEMLSGCCLQGCGKMLCTCCLDGMGRCSAENHDFRFHLLLLVPQASPGVETVIQSGGEGSER